MKAPKLLAGKTCLVTGASRGLGRSLARRFWIEGASLVLAVRKPDAVADLFSDLAAADGQSSTVVQVDLQSVESAGSLIPRTRAAGIERIDVLVNNAAVLGPIGSAWQSSPRAWNDTIVVNLTSPAIICSSAIPWMAERGGGKIINLSGGGATSPRRNFSAYAAAKAGLVRFSETLAAEAKGMGIAVNCVAPGPMGTDMLATVQEAGAEVASEREVAAAEKALGAGDATLEAATDLIVFLASRKGDRITGKLISALWDRWRDFPDHVEELGSSDVFTLRRIAGRDRGISWSDE
jgi:3-oxoacyl-[acyl-carrier protein] reductase